MIVSVCHNVLGKWRLLHHFHIHSSLDSLLVLIDPLFLASRLCGGRQQAKTSRRLHVEMCTQKMPCTLRSRFGVACLEHKVEVKCPTPRSHGIRQIVQSYIYIPWNINLLLQEKHGHYRATSHKRLGARDHCTSSTLIGGKGRTGPSLLHTTLEGPTE